MKKVKALHFALGEFRTLCDKILNEQAWIESDSSGWFWVTTEEIDDHKINELLEIEFGKEISGFRIENIFVDITEEVVMVLYK